jgi:hypothetical protein
MRPQRRHDQPRVTQAVVNRNGLGRAESAMPEKFFDGQTDVAGNLAKQKGRDISPRMAGNGGSPSIGVAELLMALLLARLRKTETFENGDDFEWFQYGTRSHC